MFQKSQHSENILMIFTLTSFNKPCHSITLTFLPRPVMFTVFAEYTIPQVHFPFDLLS